MASPVPNHCPGRGLCQLGRFCPEFANLRPYILLSICKRIALEVEEYVDEKGRARCSKAVETGENLKSLRHDTRTFATMDENHRGLTIALHRVLWFPHPINLRTKRVIWRHVDPRIRLDQISPSFSEASR